jgi:hypothetical protein
VKWGIEHLKVTLRDDAGETVVIEQSKDGAIRCEQANGARRTNAAEPAADRREAPAAERAANRREAPAAPAAAAREEPEARAKSPRRRRARSSGKNEAREVQPEVRPAKPGSLDWHPTKDSKAWGVVARSGSGQFKVLRSASSVWSLFYERLDANGQRIAKAELLACFPIDAEHKARAKAQEHHDRGVHLVKDEAEFVYEMCPAPTPGSVEAGRTRRVRTSKPVEAEPAAPAAEPAVDPAMDAAIMGGLDAILKQHLGQANP